MMSYNEYVYGYPDELTASKMRLLNTLVQNACDSVDVLKDYLCMSGVTDFNVEAMEDECEKIKGRLRRLQATAEQIEEVEERDSQQYYS